MGKIAQQSSDRTGRVAARDGFWQASTKIDRGRSPDGIVTCDAPGRLPQAAVQSGVESARAPRYLHNHQGVIFRLKLPGGRSPDQESKRSSFGRARGLVQSTDPHDFEDEPAADGHRTPGLARKPGLRKSVSERLQSFQ